MLCLYLILTLRHSYEHLIAAIAPLFHIGTEDDERHSHIAVVAAHRLEFEVVAGANNEIIARWSPLVLTTYGVAYRQPFVLFHGSLVEHVGTRLHVRLAEVATFRNLQLHGAQIFIVARQHLKRHLMLVNATSPAHITITCADGILRKTDAFHERKLLQFGTYGIPLSLRLLRKPSIEHLVLVESVVAVEDVARLVRHHTYIYSQCESHAELYRHDSHTQTSAARRESERSFQHHCRRERRAVKGRNHCRQGTHDESRNSHCRSQNHV